MLPVFISTIDDMVESMLADAVDGAIAELELFVTQFGPKVVQAVEDDIARALLNYAEALEAEKLRPPSEETKEVIASFEKAIDAMKKFPGTMSIFARDNKIVIRYQLPLVARSLNFGTRDVPKLDPSGRAVAILIKEADKQGIKLQREHLIY